MLRATGIWMRTPEEQARSLTRSADFLADFLSLVGLAALLLGGVGVGSAVAVYVRGKLDAVALLRCLGATRRQVFATYLLQAAAMGFLGSAVGVAGGVAAQRWLPMLIRDVLPVPVAASVSFGSVAFGLLLGTWVAVVFALIPLLTVRRVSPLQALRHVAEAPPRADPARWGAVAAVAVTVLALTLFEAPSPVAGLAFATALAAVAGVLWSVAWGLAWATRRFFPRRAAYTVRQGVANLFRPGNQTVAVTLALGFGVLVVGVIVQLQRNLVRELSFDQGPDGFNMLVFDVQPDQEDGVRALLEARAGGRRDAGARRDRPDRRREGPSRRGHPGRQRTREPAAPLGPAARAPSHLPRGAEGQRDDPGGRVVARSLGRLRGRARPGWTPSRSRFGRRRGRARPGLGRGRAGRGPAGGPWATRSRGWWAAWSTRRS